MIKLFVFVLKKWCSFPALYLIFYSSEGHAGFDWPGMSVGVVWTCLCCWSVTRYVCRCLCLCVCAVGVWPGMSAGVYVYVSLLLECDQVCLQVFMCLCCWSVNRHVVDMQVFMWMFPYCLSVSSCVCRCLCEHVCAVWVSRCLCAGVYVTVSVLFMVFMQVCLGCLRCVCRCLCDCGCAVWGVHACVYVNVSVQFEVCR